METYMIIILAVIAIIIFWKPLSVCRKEIPEGLTIGIKHGTKVLKLNVMEDELELQERARKIILIMPSPISLQVIMRTHMRSTALTLLMSLRVLH